MKSKTFRKIMNRKIDVYEPEKVEFGMDYAVFTFRWLFDVNKFFKMTKEVDATSNVNFKYFLDVTNTRFVIINQG